MTAPPSPAELHAIVPAAGSSRRLARLTRDRPKSLLPLAGRPLIHHSLAAMAERGLRRATIVVGYRGERLREALGARFGPIEIDYVACPDYATTEHGWSLYASRRAWARERRPVLFADADAVYSPPLLDRLLLAPQTDCVLVDAAMRTVETEEELVRGHDGRVTGLVRARGRDWDDVVGGFVGLNRFSSGVMETLFRYMSRLPEGELRALKYERVFDRLVRGGLADLAYLDSAGLPWINVNREADYRRAARLLAGAPPP